MPRRLLLLMTRATVVWFAILILAIVNGAFRQAVLVPQMGAVVGHVLSTLLLSSAVVLMTWLLLGWIRPESSRNAWLIGVYWLAATVAFEFLAGHYLFAVPWETLVADYRIDQGRIWPLVLLLTLVAPAIVPARQRSRGRDKVSGPDERAQDAVARPAR
jgi:hypothetical protein